MKQYIAFSGGADSTALALLMPEATPIFTDTGWEFPELYAHIKKFESMTGRKVKQLSRGITIPEYIKASGFMPNHGARYCTRMFKIEPMNKFLKNNLPAELMIGLRADEDGRVGNQSEIDGLTIRYPLRERGMTRINVVRVCLENDLLPRYPVYMARGGCVGCFYKRKSEVQAMAALVPDILDELQSLEEGVQDRRGKYFVMFPNVNTPIRVVRNQPTLLSPEQIYADAADKSDYGHNCGLFCNR